MKQNSCSIVGEVAKPSGVGLDELDCAIESFGTSIVNLLILVDPVNNRKLGDTIKLPRIIRDQRHTQT